MVLNFIFIAGLSVSNIRRLDSDKQRMNDKMLAELAESSSAERIHLDSWLNPSTSNTKSCCDRVQKKYFVGKGTTHIDFLDNSYRKMQYKFYEFMLISMIFQMDD